MLANASDFSSVGTVTVEQGDHKSIDEHFTNVTNSTLPEENVPNLYLEDHFGFMTLTAFLLSSTAVIGTLGNFLIIFAVCFVKTLRTTGNLFVVNLAMADLLITVLIVPFNAVGVVAGRSVLMHNQTLCEWIASLCTPACLGSMSNLFAISLNRCILICKPHLYPSLFTFPKTICMCIGIWIIAHLLHLPNHLVTMGVIVPLIGVLYCYAFIFKRVRGVKQQLRQHRLAVTQAEKHKDMNVSENENTRRSKKPGFNQDDVKLAKTLFVAFVVFLVCWLPFALLVMAHQPNGTPGWIYTMAILIGHSNSAVNPILYGCSNKKFREGYRNVLGLSRKTAPQPTNGGQRTIQSHDNPIYFTKTRGTERPTARTRQ